MNPRVRYWVPLAVAILVTAGIDTRAGKPFDFAQGRPTVPDVLQAAGDYLVQYSQRLGAVAAEELYTQYDTSTGQVGVPTRLNADVVFVGLGAGAVTAFRDVIAIGGAPLRPRDDRLLTLFTATPASSRQQALRLTDDSVRHYVSPNLRLLDQPMIALEVLRKSEQERFTFTLDSVKTMSGAQVAILKFSERDAPRLIPFPEERPATGRVWIDVTSGTIRQTELGLAGKSVNLRATVTYKAEPKLGIWLPVEMYQQVDVFAGASGVMTGMGSGGGYSGRQALEGRAYYSKFRQVQIDVSKIK